MTERCFKLLLVLVFLASFLFPSSVSADAGFSPAHPSVEGDMTAFAVYLWDPSCGDRSRSALGLTQSTYDDMVTAIIDSGEPVELGRAMPSIGSRASAGCSIALVRVVVTPRAGEGWGAALEAARWINGVRRWGFRGAEHTGRHREFLEALCAMTILRGSDCRATDAEITLASAQAGTTADLWVPVTYFAKVGNGDASRAELDPAMPSCSLPAARRSLTWGLALWYKGPCGETRPPRFPRPPVSIVCDPPRPPGCNCVMPVVDLPDRATGFVMVEGLFGVMSGACNVHGWPPAPAAEVAPEVSVVTTSFCDGNLTDYPDECLDVATFTSAQDALNTWQGIVQAGGKVTTFFPDGGGCYVLIFCIP